MIFKGKKSKFLVFICTICISLVSLKPENEYLKSHDLNDLWKLTVGQYLTDTLWNNKNIYDAGHCLMVPLHYAFMSGNKEWKLDFHEHFRRFSEDLSSIDDGLLNKLHYVYLLSRYLVLSASTNEYTENYNNLYDFLIYELDKIWYSPAWQWDSKPFPSMSERIEWKLNTSEVKYGYYKAILDEDIFVFAIAGDIRQITKILHIDEPRFIDEVLAYADIVFHSAIQYNNDGSWLFQPGVWADHPDFIYAGQQKKSSHLTKKPVKNISWDSSHSYRFPLWLSSLQDANESNTESWTFYKKLKDGLKTTFIKNVLVWPSENFRGIRLNNYMDGNNGIYRWGYITQGQNQGYGPYELSGNFFLGWWSFLKSDSVNQAYTLQSELFPLKQDEITLYVGPNTTRVRNPLVEHPAMFTNGFAELLTRLAAQINELDH